jgi:hypothetical protein
MNMDTLRKTPANGPSRKTLASQLDRLEGMLDGLDTALAGAVQDAVEQAVKQAVQAVLTEVLTNRDLQEQLQQAAQPAPPPQPSRGLKGTASRLWQATSEATRQAVRKVKQLGRRAGMVLLAVGGVVVGLVYAARQKIASAAVAVYDVGKRLIHKAGMALARLLPSFVFSG